MIMHQRTYLQLFLSIFIFIVLSTSLFAGGEAELWDRWVISDENSTEILDHSPWQSFLDTYRELDSDGVALIRYGDVSSSDRAALDGYVSYLESVDVDSLNSDEQFAYWVNLYNSATIQLILQEYPVASIRRIPGAGVLSPGPWDVPFLSISGEQVSLDDIEHRILRPRWQEPRIHFVVNCASIGCPNVPSEALTAENSEQLMEQGAIDYLNNPRGVRRRGNQLVVSSIFSWFAVDFGDDQEEILRYIDQFRDIDQYLTQIGRDYSSVNVRYEYDWDLNE